MPRVPIENLESIQEIGIHHDCIHTEGMRVYDQKTGLPDTRAETLQGHCPHIARASQPIFGNAVNKIIVWDALAFEPKRGKGATMKLVFHCQPQRWNIDGQRWIRLEESGIMKNPFPFRAKPVIRVYGSGAGKVCVRDVEISILANDGYIDLDCETHNASNQNGFCNNYVKSGDFPELEPGRNVISWEGTITALEIMPRWWTL